MFFFYLNLYLIFISHAHTQIRRSLKIRTRRKEKDKLPSGITADYSADFFANLNVDQSSPAADVGPPNMYSSPGGGGHQHHQQQHHAVLPVLMEQVASGGYADDVDKRISYSDSSDTSLYSLGKVSALIRPNLKQDYLGGATKVYTL